MNRTRRPKRDPRHAILFEPIQIGPKTLKNRFCQTPHCSHFGVELPGSQAYLRGTKAAGGWALVNTEYCSIHPESDDYPRNSSRLWDDGDVANLALMCDEAHRHGALAGVQLWYGAAHAANLETRLAARGVSQLNSDEYMSQACYEMSIPEIHELQGYYVDAARRARAAGFDVINVYGGHFHTITHQFLDPFYNRRTDEYGGSFENRARFWLEVLEMIREAVGDDCAIAARFGVEALREGLPGITVEEEGVGFVERADHLVDVWDLIVGNITNAAADSTPSRFYETNSQADWARQIKPHTSKPVIGVGRFVDPDVMVAVIESGHLDIIGAARPSIADPFIPMKISEGRVDDIRECIGCNICLASVWGNGSRLICTQNATVGEEYRRGWHPERFDRARNHANDVLVLGAGPAGMECARVLGERGMRRVHLVEGHSEIGGSMRWIPTLPGLGEWGRVVNWRAIQLAKLRNVEVITGSRLSADEVLSYGAELVVIATGSSWSADGINPITHAPIRGAAEHPDRVYTPDQILADGRAVAGEQVVVYDCEGYFMGASLAERLLLEGKRVRLVTPAAEVAGFTFETLEGPGIQRRLYELGAELVTQHALQWIEATGVRAAHHYDPSGVVEWSADAVVLVTQRLSDDAIYRGLTADQERWTDEGITGVYRVGDCVQPRLVADAIFDGHRLAREIDSENPAIPLPFRRERYAVVDTDRGLL
jgi:dimethylamine/trimethylamine dehydrogenase